MSIIDQNGSRRRTIVWLVPFVLFASLIVIAVVATIGQRSMWYDEAYTYCFTTASWNEFVSTIKRLDIGIAFYYLLLRGWALVAGDSQTSLRMFSAVFSIASIAAVFLLSREFFSARVAIISSLLLLSNSFWFAQAQTARVYSFAMFLGIVTSICYCRMLRSTGVPKWIAAYALTLMILTISQFAVALTVFAGHCLSFFTMDRRKLPPRLFAAIAVFLALYLLAAGFIVATLGTTLVHTPIPVTFLTIWQQLSLLLGRKFALALVGGLVLFSAFSGIRNGDGRLVSLTIWTATPVVSIIALSYSNSAALGARYMIAALPPLIVLASFAIDSVPRPNYKIALIAAALLVELAGLAAYFKEPWPDFNRQVARLSGAVRPGDVVVFSPPYLAVRIYAALHYDRLALRDGARTDPGPLSAAWRLVDQEAQSAAWERVPVDPTGTLWVVTYRDPDGSKPCTPGPLSSTSKSWRRVEPVCILQK